MTVFAGHHGSIELKRLAESRVLNLEVTAEDVDNTRKRFTISNGKGLDLPHGTITTGDRVLITTKDNRGLPFRLYLNAENTQYIDNPTGDYLPLEFFAHVDAMGAIRMYRTFSKALSNSGDEYLAVPLSVSLSDLAWEVQVAVLPGAYHQVGKVQGFTLSTERESVDTTTLGDSYRGFSHAAVSGSGSVDCLFDFKSVDNQEVPFAIAELIQKIEIGSKFQGKFYILEPFGDQPRGFNSNEGVFYEVNGMFVRSSMTVRADQIVECSFDFITSGQFFLRAGENPVPITTEADVNIGNETTLEDLGVFRESN